MAAESNRFQTITLVENQEAGRKIYFLQSAKNDMTCVLFVSSLFPLRVICKLSRIYSSLFYIQKRISFCFFFLIIRISFTFFGQHRISFAYIVTSHKWWKSKNTANFSLNVFLWRLFILKNRISVGNKKTNEINFNLWD